MVEPVHSSYAPVPSAVFDVVVGRIRERFLKLVEELRSDGLSLESEEAILAMTSEIGRALMADAIRATDLGALVVECQSRRWKRLQQVTVGRYGTMYGEVEVRRPLYRQADVRNGEHLDVVAVRSNVRDGFTPKARAAIGHAVQAAPAREAHAIMESAGVLPYSRSTFLRVADGLGADWCGALDAAPSVLAAWDPQFLAQAAAIVVEVDRVAVPMAEPRELTPSDVKKGVARPITVAYRMSYCGAIALIDSEGETLDVMRTSDEPGNGAETVRSVLRSWLHLACDSRPDLRVATLGDGAQEIQNLLSQITANVSVAARLTDWYHLTEYLAAAVRGLGDAADKTALALQHEVFARRNGIDDVEAWLREKSRTNEVKAVTDAARYIENHRHLMDYVGAREAGLPIGSGMIEATCKTVVGVRMKRAGARWSVEGASHLLGLRSLATSGDRWKDGMINLERHFSQDVQVAA
jgi:hypothetical protein